MNHIVRIKMTCLGFVGIMIRAQKQLEAFGVRAHEGIAGNSRIGTAVKSFKNGIVISGRYPRGKVTACGKADGGNVFRADHDGRI